MDDRPRRGWRWWPAAPGRGRRRGGWDGTERRRPRPGPVSPGLQALFDDLARLDGVVVPAALGPPNLDHGGLAAASGEAVALGRAPAAPLGREGEAAPVVDLAEFRARRAGPRPSA